MIDAEVINMNTNALDRSAKIVRILSAPPFAAALFVLTLYYSSKGIVTEKIQLTAMLVCLSALPVAAYPLSLLMHMSRSKQRTLAMILSFAAYSILAALSLYFNWNYEIKLISLTYFASSVWLIVFNKIFKLKASGHSCAVTGPGVMVCALVNIKLLPACVLLYALVLWASLKTKRHSLKEYLLGSLCFILANALAYVLLL